MLNFLSTQWASTFVNLLGLHHKSVDLKQHQRPVRGIQTVALIDQCTNFSENFGADFSNKF